MEIQTEEALFGLIGESESIELEFKGPEDFLSWPQGKQNVARSLSKEVSALANSYGGQIIIGMKESRETPRRAESIEGVDPRSPAIETIQRIIESNIHPRLEGIRYRVIRLGGANAGRVAYVISVPQGHTVYQAGDKLYYGRSEYESVPLEDQLIRYKMVRERLAEATVDVIDTVVETALGEYERRQRELEDLTTRRIDNEDFVFLHRSRREKLEAPPRDFDEYSFSIAIRNIGAITIHDCLLEAAILGLSDAKFKPAGSVHEGGHRWSFRFGGTKTVRAVDAIGRQTSAAAEARLFPSQQVVFPGAQLTFTVPTSTEFANVVLNWKLYMDDSPPLSGTLSLGDLLMGLGRVSST